MSLSEDELSALAELVNIGVGEAAARVAELLGIYLTLHIPSVEVGPTEEVLQTLVDAIGCDIHVDAVSQSFKPRLRGDGYFVVDSRFGPEAAKIIFGGTEKEHVSDVITEVGNMVLGACVGRIAEMLDTYVSYMPPSMCVFDAPASAIKEVPRTHERAMLIRAGFTLEGSDYSGYLFMLVPADIVDWLHLELSRLLVA